MVCPVLQVGATFEELAMHSRLAASSGTWRGYVTSLVLHSLHAALCHMAHQAQNVLQCQLVCPALLCPIPALLLFPSWGCPPTPWLRATLPGAQSATLLVSESSFCCPWHTLAPLAAIVMARLGASQVVATDLPGNLELLQDNCQANGGRSTAHQECFGNI